MLEPVMNLASAFGLSSAAGLNAYIPLLTVSIMANRGILHLASPFDVMASPWCITLLIVLLLVEMVVDKIPGADHINDIVQTVVRPTAGAILFASQAGHLDSAHPALWAGLGILSGGGVHATKALARPVINVTTAGFGAPIVSVVEDLVSTVLAILAIVVPILAVLVMAIFAFLFYKLFRKLFWRKRQPIAVSAVAVPASQPAFPPQAQWGGGV